jgi:LysM repeat protein
VKKRDTLRSLATRYKVTVEQIRGWNSLHQDKLAAGQKLELYVRPTARSTPHCIQKQEQQNYPSDGQQWQVENRRCSKIR